MGLTDKAAMRAEFRKKRDDYSAAMRPQDKSLAFSQAPTPLKKLYHENCVLAAYIPIGSEANPMRLLDMAQQAGCTTALPHVTSKAAPMRFLRWQVGDDLEDGPFGLQQPKADAEILTPNLILVPLIAFDRTGARLGQGAGHYDRALSIIDHKISIGVAWSVQEADPVPVDPWDEPLSAILTEKEWIEI